MNKTELIKKINSTKSVVEFYKLKEAIISLIDEKPVVIKSAPNKVEKKEEK